MTWAEWVDHLKAKKRKHSTYIQERKNLLALHTAQLNAIASEECQKKKKTSEYYGKLIAREKDNYKKSIKALKNRFGV